MTVRTRELPESIQGLVLAKKLQWIAVQGVKNAPLLPHYGQACDCSVCESDDTKTPALEPDYELYLIGPKGRPYSDVANAWKAIQDHKNIAEMLGGHWQFRSQVMNKESRPRKKTVRPPGYLLARWVPGVQGGEAL